MSDAVQGMLGLPDAEDWPQFVQETVPALREKGWRVEMTGSFRFNMIEIEDIDGQLQQTEGGWFDLEMGVTVNDRRGAWSPCSLHFSSAIHAGYPDSWTRFRMTRQSSCIPTATNACTFGPNASNRSCAHSSICSTTQAVATPSAFRNGI